MEAPTFRLKLSNRQRRIVRAQLEAVLYFEGSSSYLLPDLGLDRLSRLADKLNSHLDAYDGAELWWMDDLAAALLDGRDGGGEDSWDRHDLDAIEDLRHKITRLIT